MIHRIPSVMGILLVSMLAQSVSGRIGHAQEQSSPTLPNSDVRLQADIAFWLSIEHSEDPRNLKDYLEQFPDGQFVVLAHRRLRAKIAVRGEALLNKWGRTAMHRASRDNDVEVLEWLTAQGGDLDAPHISRTPMHAAAESNAVDEIIWLKAQGAGINALASYDQTPMHLAAKNNAVDAMKWLEAQGVDINARSRFDQTPMDLTAENNTVDAMKWLKAQGVDINARSRFDQTPMDLAAENDAVDAMEWLKAQGPTSPRGQLATILRCTPRGAEQCSSRNGVAQDPRGRHQCAG